MSDIATVWVPAEGRGDWAMAGPDLLKGRDLATSVLISLFTDARAAPDDVLPDASGDPRGWWGDAGRDRPLGSKLWLLERAKRTEETRLRAQDYAQDALAWLVEDGIAASVTVEAAWTGEKMLGVQVTIAEPDGRQVVFNYQWAWKGVG